MANNFIPMSMVPFIANMDNTSKVTPEPAPTPFSPRKFFEKVVTFDFGEAEKIIWAGQQEMYVLPNLDGEIFLKLRELTESRFPDIPSFKFKFEGKDYIIISYTTNSDTTLNELVDIDMDDASMTEHHTFELIELQVDAETGDTAIELRPKEE